MVMGPGHWEDIGWVEDPLPYEREEPAEEIPYEGPMPEAEVGGWE